MTSNLQNSLEKFNPDLIVFNAGTDILANDPLGLLSISPEVSVSCLFTLWVS